MIGGYTIACVSIEVTKALETSFVDFERRNHGQLILEFLLYRAFGAEPTKVNTPSSGRSICAAPS